MQSLSKTKLSIIALFIFAVGGVIGYYSKPAKVETIEIVKVVEVVKEKEDTKKNTKTIEVKKPDGTVITKTETQEETKKEKEQASEKQILSQRKEEARANWSISILIKPQEHQPAHGLLIEKRVFGNIKAGVFGTIDKSYGISLGLEF